MDLKELIKKEIDRVKDLSPEQQRALLLNLKKDIYDSEKEEFKRQGKEPIEFYEPFKKQERFHRDPRLVRIITGGNGAGKTMVGSAEVWYRATKTHPFDNQWNVRSKPQNIMVIVEDTKQAKQPGASQDKILSMIPKDMIEFVEKNIIWEKKGVLDTIILPDGGKIFFRSSQSGRKSIQGGRIHAIWVDENCIKNADYFDEMLTRITEYGIPLIFVTATPNLESDKDEFLEEVLIPRCEDTEKYDQWSLTQISLWDNPHIREETKQFLLENLTGDAAQVAARMEGTSTGTSGLIYPTFSRDIHIIPPVLPKQLKKEAAYIYRIIDPHPVKPIAVLFIAVMHDGRIIIFNELYNKGQVDAVAKQMKNICDGLGSLIKKTIMDYSANTPSKVGTGKSVRDEFKLHGISAVNCHKDMSMGIKYVRQILSYTTEKDPILYVCGNCINTIREFGKYRINKKTGDILKKYDDMMDCLRYFVCDREAQDSFKYISNEERQGRKGNVRIIKEGLANNDAAAKNSRLRARQLKNQRLLGVGVGR